MRASPHGWYGGTSGTSESSLVYPDKRKVGPVRPSASPYTARARTINEMNSHTRFYKYCIVDRHNIPIFLFTTITEAEFVAEKINLNMAKAVLSAP